MSVTPLGALNTNALIVPGLYVQVVPPQTIINGIPTDIVGVVGTASYGPVNTPVVVGSYADFKQYFGDLVPRANDLGTQVAKMTQQGAQNFRCIRVTDGTDTAATATLTQGGSIQLTAKYTGSWFGNNVNVVFSGGTRSATQKVSVVVAGFGTVEVFDNIPLGSMASVQNAINNGIGLQGPSQWLVASAASGSLAAAIYPSVGPAASAAWTNGTDGVGAVTSATLVGVDSAPRTGMYALRGQGASIMVLSDMTDVTKWTTVASLADAEGIYAILETAAGDTPGNAATEMYEAGLDDYGVKICFGDWLDWYDAVNQTTRLTGPAAFLAGKLAMLAPHQSSLNKKLVGIVGSQKSGMMGSAVNGQWSDADKAAMFSSRMDLVCSPSPGGTYWSAGLGHNSSSNPGSSGDNYTRMTNFLAFTFNAAMGVYVGQVISPDLFNQVHATFAEFLGNLRDSNMIAAFSVLCDTTNNPQSRTALGYLQADVQVQYLGINEKFIVNLQGGTTVQIVSQGTMVGGAPAASS
jgi:phage tail sheath protein FI